MTQKKGNLGWFSIFLVIIFLESCAKTPIYLDKDKDFYQGHGEGSIADEELLKFIPTPINPDFSYKIQRILDLRSPSGGVIDRDAKMMAFNWNVTGNTQVWMLDISRGLPYQLTGGEEAAFLNGMTPDGKILFISRDNKGDEYQGLYMMELDGERTLIPIYNPNRVTVSLNHISLDGRFIYYSANDIKSSDYAIYRYDLKKRERELLYAGEGHFRLTDSNEEGTFIFSKMISSVHNEHYLFDQKTKKLIPLLGQNEVEEYRVSFGYHKGEYIVRTSKFHDFKRLYRYSEKDKKFMSLTNNQDADIFSYSLSPNRRRLVYTVNQKGAFIAESLDLKNFTKLTLPFTGIEPSDLSVFINSTNSDVYSLMSTYGYNTATTHYLYNHHNKKLRAVSVPSVPEISIKNFTKDTLEYYPARDGTLIPMWVKRGDNCKNTLCPVLVNFHGGPESEARPGFDAGLELFIESGFVVVRPNVRGSSGHGKRWLTADDGPKRLQVISDIEDAARFIKKNWAKDGVSPKVGVYGGSYGGYATYMAMTKFAGSYDAGVAIVGMSSLVTFLQNTADYRRALRESEYGSLDNDREALIELSPITYIDKIKSPLLIIHGLQDPRVPVGEALQFYQKMKKKNIDGDLIIFPDEGHGVRKRSNRVLQLGHTLQFFEKHLK